MDPYKDVVCHPCALGKKVLHAARDSQKHITDIKWAPSGLNLAMGSADGKIYVYRWVAVRALGLLKKSQWLCYVCMLTTLQHSGTISSFVVVDDHNLYFIFAGF